jgi:hypothetical protein
VHHIPERHTQTPEQPKANTIPQPCVRSPPPPRPSPLFSRAPTSSTQSFSAARSGAPVSECPTGHCPRPPRSLSQCPLSTHHRGRKVNAILTHKHPGNCVVTLPPMQPLSRFAGSSALQITSTHACMHACCVCRLDRALGGALSVGPHKSHAPPADGDDVLICARAPLP